MLGHTNICITHVAFDRAHFSSLSTALAQRQAAYYQVGAWAGSGQAEMLKNQDWFLATGCAAHDCQNALKWGQRSSVSDPESAAKGLYIGIESCRNAYNLLFLTLSIYLRDHLQLAAHPLPSYDSLYSLWSDLGIVPNVAEELAMLGLLYEHGRVWVRPELEGTDNLFGRVHGAFLSVMKFRKFTESRWVTVGQCSRDFIAAHVVGLPAIVQAIRDSPLSNYYIHGYWDYLNPDSLKLAIVVALAGRVVDAALLLILEDDRLAGRAHELEAAMQDEWEWLVAIPDDTWERLSLIVSEIDPPEALRADCLLAAQASHAFVHFRLMRVLESYPWKLCTGAIGDRLDELQGLPEARDYDDTTCKIYDLLHMGLSREKIVSAIELMKQCPFSTRGVEQAHASCATICRYHPLAGLDSITARGLLHAAKPFFQDPEADALGKGLQRLQRKLACLEGKSGSGRTGRQLFLSEMMPQLLHLRTDPQARKAGAQWSFAHHTEQCNLLTEPEKKKYEEKARVHRDAFFADISEQMAGVRREISQKRRDIEAHHRGEGLSPVTLSGNKLAERDAEPMEELHQQPQFRGTSLLQLRLDALAVQDPLPEHEVSYLKNVKVKIAGLSNPGICEWLRRVAWLRNEFHGKVLVVSLGTAREQSYLFSFALQNPGVVAFQQLEKLQVVLPRPRDIQGKNLREMLVMMDEIWPWQFQLQLRPPTFGWELSDVPRNTVWVLQHCVVVGTKVTSPSQPVPFEEFVADLPTFTSRATAGSGKSSKAGHYGTSPSTASSSGEAAHREHQQQEDPVLEDVAPFEELAEPEKLALQEWMAAKKVELQEMRDIECVHFAAHYRGGAWTATHHGVGTNVVVGEAQSEAAAEWAKKKVGRKTVSFSIKKFHEDAACALACFWSDRTEYFYSCHLEGRLVDGLLTDEPRAAAPKPTLCERIMATKDVRHPGHVRMVEILMTEPKA